MGWIIFVAVSEVFVMNACFVGIFVFLWFYLSLGKFRLCWECLWLNKWGRKEKEITFVNWMIKVGEKKLWASSNDTYPNLLRHGLPFLHPSFLLPQTIPATITSYCIYYFPPVFSFSLECGCSGYGLVFNCSLPYSCAVIPKHTWEGQWDLVQAPFLKMVLSFPKPPFMVAFSSFSGLLVLLVGRFLV